MNRNTSQTDLDAALRRLAAKYAVELPGDWRLDGRSLAAGWTLIEPGAAKGAIPLLPWRSERRFVQLKRLVTSGTIENVVMMRSSCLSTGEPMGLAAILYREFDLAEFLAGSPIVALHASIADGQAANVILRLAGGILCSVEAGTTLPAGSDAGLLDRHELIARRGVASDRAVDTLVPQSSVYTFTDRGAERFTDTDAELFGLEADEVSLVRVAFELAREPDRCADLHAQHRRLTGLVELAFESDRTRRRLTVEGGGL